MKKLFQKAATYFGLLSVVFLVLGLGLSQYWTWVLGQAGPVSVLSLLLGVIMFGMGTTLNYKDFLIIFKRPKDVFLGAVAQYTIMPLLPSLKYLLLMPHLLPVLFSSEPVPEAPPRT